MPYVSRQSSHHLAGHRALWLERLMAPYVFSFMIDAASLVLGLVLGAVAALAMVMIVKNL